MMFILFALCSYLMASGTSHLDQNNFMPSISGFIDVQDPESRNFIHEEELLQDKKNGENRPGYFEQLSSCLSWIFVNYPNNCVEERRRNSDLGSRSMIRYSERWNWGMGGEAFNCYCCSIQPITFCCLHYLFSGFPCDFASINAKVYYPFLCSYILPTPACLCLGGCALWSQAGPLCCYALKGYWEDNLTLTYADLVTQINNELLLNDLIKIKLRKRDYIIYLQPGIESGFGSFLQGNNLYKELENSNEIVPIKEWRKIEENDHPLVHESINPEAYKNYEMTTIYLPFDREEQYPLIAVRTLTKNLPTNDMILMS